MGEMEPANEETKKLRDLSGGLSCSRRIMKLKTKEDPIHLHKTLGMLSLSHFLYRYAWVYPTTGELGFEDHDTKDWLAVAIHQALATSSLIFTVILHRIMDKPTIIWEEYRLHAIVFSLRGASVFVFHALWPAIEDPARPGHYGSDLQCVCLLALIVAHHIVVDLITKWYGNPAETTVRGDGKRAGPKFKRLMRFYSLYQFLALGGHLTVHKFGCDNGWNPMIAVQSSAFCMTLYRKRLIRGKTHALIYSVCLLVSALHIVRIMDGYEHFLLKVFCAYFMRVQLGVDKYVIWTLFSLSFMPTVQDIAAQIYASLCLHALSASAAVGSGAASEHLANLSAITAADPSALATAGGWEASTFNFSVPAVSVSATALEAWSLDFIPAHNDYLMRAGTLLVGLVALLRMRKDERDYPKSNSDMKRIDAERKEKKKAEHLARIDQKRLATKGKEGKAQ